MSDEPKQKRRFPAVIDLTSKAQEAAKIAANPPAPAETTDPDALDTSLDALPEAAQAAARSAGWTKTMPVQARTMPYLLDGRDVIVQSKTGSGKTGAFLLPLFARLDPARRGAQALVLTPTRELAKQIYEEFLRLKGNRPEVQGLDAVLVYGGVGYGEQTAGLKGGAQLVIGTPGRILDHLERRTLNLDGLSTLVLDEADEMLSMGFLPAMNKLRRYLPDARQSTMFSATMPPTVRRLAETFLTEPTFLALAGGDVNVDALAHRFYVVPAMDKDRALVRLIELENPETAILFANTKREVEYLAQFLRNYGHDAGELSGDLNQNAREAIMQRLRDGNLRFLVATDVAARGIDISDLSHVIQYDVPQDPEYYVHRAGRTARAGKTGVSITLTTAEDKNKLLAIARRYDLDFDERPLPTDEQVTERVRERLTTVLEDRYRDSRTLARERAARFEPLVTALAAEEPHLLAMLLDGLYHDSLHAKPQDELNRLAQQRATERREREWDDDGGRGRRGRNRRDDRKRDEPRSASEPPATDAPRSDERTAAPPTAPPLDALRAGEVAMPVPAHDTDERLEPSHPAATPPEPSSDDNDRRRRRGKRRRGDRTEPVEPSTAEATDETPPVPTDTASDEATASADDAATNDAELADNPSPSDSADSNERGSGRSRRRGRGRRKPNADAAENDVVADASAQTEAAAPSRQTGADVLPPPPPARPTAAAAPPEPAEPADAKTRPKPARSAKKTAAVYSVFELRSMSDEALREAGADVLDTLPDDRNDLLYAILDAQAVRESSGRGRRGSEPQSGRGRAGDRSSEKRSSDKRSGKPADKREPAKGESPKGDAKPSASSETSKPQPAKADASKSSRRKRRRKDGAGPLVPMATDAAPASAEPSETPAADAPQREAKPRRARAKKTDAETPVVETSEAPAAEAKPKRSRAKQTDEAGDAPEAKPTRSRSKKADDTPTDAEPAAEKPKRSRAKKTDDATDEAPATKPTRAKKADAPVAETPDVTPKRSRATKAETSASSAEADETPKRSRSKKADAETSDAQPDAAKPTRPRAKKADATDTEDAPKPRSRSKKSSD